MGTSVRKNLYWNTLLRIPVRIICFFVSIAVARLLEPADFGIMAITMMCVGYANLITNFGFNEAVIQQSIQSQKTISTIFTVDLIISTFLAVVFVAGAGVISVFFHEPRSRSVIMVMSLVFIVTSFSGIPAAIIRRDNNFQLLAVWEMSRSLVTSVLTLVLAVLHFSYWSLAYGQLLPLCIFTVVICLKTRWVPALSFEFKLLKPVLHFGWWSFLKSQTTFVVSHLENIIVGRMLGSYSLGIYDKAKSIAVTPSESILMNINSVMFSTFSANKHDDYRTKEHFGKSIFLIGVISFPLYAGFIAISPYFVSILLGDKWVEMIIPLNIVLAGYLFKSYGGLLTSFNVAVGKYKNQTLLTILSGFSLILFCFSLVRYGIIGISIAFFLYSFVEFVLYVILSLSIIKVGFLYFFKCVFSPALSALIMFFSLQYFSIHSFCSKITYNMVALIAIGVVIYVVCMLIDRSKYSVDLKRQVFSDVMDYIGKKYGE